MREDPEQKAKCDETMELLLAAGYFRVRIKGLSDFDKVMVLFFLSFSSHSLALINVFCLGGRRISLEYSSM